MEWYSKALTPCSQWGVEMSSVVFKATVHTGQDSMSLTSSDNDAPTKSGLARMQRSGRILFVPFHMIALQSFIIYDLSMKDRPACVWGGAVQLCDAGRMNENHSFRCSVRVVHMLSTFNCKLGLG